jgi:hypothetical protein
VSAARSMSNPPAATDRSSATVKLRRPSMSAPTGESVVVGGARVAASRPGASSHDMVRRRRAAADGSAKGLHAQGRVRFLGACPSGGGSSSQPTSGSMPTAPHVVRRPCRTSGRVVLLADVARGSAGNKERMAFLHNAWRGQAVRAGV